MINNIFRNIINISDYVTILCLICFYYLVPKGADFWVILPCLLIFYFLFFKSLQKPIQIGNIKSFIKIDVLFYAFSYLLYYLPYQKYILSFSVLETPWFFNDYIEYSNPSIILSTIALLIFDLGYRTYKNNNNKRKHTSTVPDLFYINFVIGTILLLIIALMSYYFLQNGLKSLYKYAVTDVEIVAKSGYREIQYFVMLLSGMLVYCWKYCRKFNLVIVSSIIVSFFWTIYLLLLGDRNSFFLVGIIFVAGYFTLFKSILRKNIFLLFIGALFLYFTVEIVRGSESRDLATYISAYNSISEIEGVSFDITTVGYRATLDIVPNKHDYFYGKFLLVSFSNCIPFLTGILISNSDMLWGSGQTITYYLLGPKASWGLGSNIISDLYMDFGLLGVLLFMFLLGRFAIWVQCKFEKNPQSLKWVVIYFMTLALFAELPRYGLGFIVRSLVWTFLFFGVLKLFRKKLYA